MMYVLDLGYVDVLIGFMVVWLMCCDGASVSQTSCQVENGLCQLVNAHEPKCKVNDLDERRVMLIDLRAIRMIRVMSRQREEFIRYNKSGLE